MIRTRTGRPASRALVSSIALAACAISACSTDSRNSLGADNDLIGSKPGVIFEDTLAAFADTVLTYGTAIASRTVLEFGRVSGYQRSMVIQISFSAASVDTAKTVETAFLRLTADDVAGSIPARFYRLMDSYAEGDSIPALDTLAVIPDPGTGSPNRTLQTLPRDYELPASLVQGWIRDEIERTAIAIVYTDDVNDVLATFKSLQSATDRPQLVVNFVGGTQSLYRASGDATFVRETTPGADLVVSDGHVRRVYFRLPLDSLAGDAAVHNARVRLHLVAGSVLGDNSNLVVFIPASADPASKDFRGGQLVTTTTFKANSDFVDFSMTNAVAIILQGLLDDNGVVVRFDAENSELRQVRFYGSSAPDSLRPRMFVTTSTPADFRPPGSP